MGWVRWEVATLMFTGLVFNYSLRLNLAIAIVEMSNSTITILGDTKTLNWSKDETNNLLSAFFYGYVVMQIPGGRLAEVFGTKKVFGSTMVAASILTALTPVAAYFGLWFVFALRVVQGLLNAVTFPSMNPMTTRWAPEKERNRFVSYAYMGGSVGTVLTYPFCGWLLSQAPWQWVFYVTGGASLLWSILWFALVHDLPEDHPRISAEEREMIMAGRSFDPKAQKEELETPTLPLIWQMLQSPAVLVVMATDFCCGWGNACIISMTPTFMKEVLGFDIANNGVMSMLPHLARTIVGNFAGFLSDLLLRTGMKPLTAQKIFQATSFLLPAAGMFAISQLSTNQLSGYCVAAMTIGYGFQGTQYSGHYANMITIGPNRSGTTFGLVNFAGNLPGFLTPILNSALTKGIPENEHDQLSTAWGHFWWILSGMYVLGTVIFALFARGEVQPFNSVTFHQGETSESSKYGSVNDGFTDEESAQPSVNSRPRYRKNSDAF